MANKALSILGIIFCSFILVGIISHERKRRRVRNQAAANPPVVRNGHAESGAQASGNGPGQAPPQQTAGTTPLDLIFVPLAIIGVVPIMLGEGAFALVKKAFARVGKATWNRRAKHGTQEARTEDQINDEQSDPAHVGGGRENSLSQRHPSDPVGATDTPPAPPPPVYTPRDRQVGHDTDDPPSYSEATSMESGDGHDGHDGQRNFRHCRGPWSPGSMMSRTLGTPQPAPVYQEGR